METNKPMAAICQEILQTLQLADQALTSIAVQSFGFKGARELLYSPVEHDAQAKPSQEAQQTQAPATGNTITVDDFSSFMMGSSAEDPPTFVSHKTQEASDDLVSFNFDDEPEIEAETEIPVQTLEPQPLEPKQQDTKATFDPLLEQAPYPTVLDGFSTNPNLSTPTPASQEEIIILGPAISEPDEPTDSGFQVMLEQPQADVGPDEATAFFARPRPGWSSQQLTELLARCQGAIDEGEIHEAIALYSAALDADPNHFEACLGRGRLYLDLGDYARAMSDFMGANNLNPENPEPRVAMGDLYFSRKDYRRAIEYFNEAITMSPQHSMAHCRRGLSHYYRKNFDEALTDLTAAKQLDPTLHHLDTYIVNAQHRSTL